MLKRYAAQVNEAMVFADVHSGKRVVLASSEPVSQVIRIDHQMVEGRNIYRLLGALGCYAPAFRSGAVVQRKILNVLRQAADQLTAQ